MTGAAAAARARELAEHHALGAGEPVLRTQRLLLRRWREADLDPFAAMSADPEVMRHFPAPLDRAASDAVARYGDACFEVHGFGLAAVERLDDGAFVGFVGLHRQRWFPEDVEIGWRLARTAWGAGLATEAARAWVASAHRDHGLRRLISITAPANAASLAVMRRLGMREAARGVREGRQLVVHALRLPAADG
ncbi:GNAT family N-acetyltransferase [Quadrisphaera sp. DSM 44207]|uniref:GNAT family N-acetyltransferase n=1 Tax=Quadrisphaera sp. DSM 44207 TaxID=1881057 RepID=UPI000888B315|nr:GNAT family N-acetyltransferase [Quadrisphaera sp. DSM 44207]SDQ52929.1 Protein N-acetyltransferase, RimJ/RimL family [Quadrisphaera sp. DSM 44207]